MKLSKERVNLKKGFTLVEIMVVAVIIGLLASLTIPAFTQSRRNSVASRTANDFRQFAQKFEIHNIANGQWPPDGFPGTIPAGMEDSLNGGAWGSSTGIGGRWDFDFNQYGFVAAVSIEGFTSDQETLESIDFLIDDGNLNTGKLVQANDSHLSFVLEE